MLDPEIPVLNTERKMISARTKAALAQKRAFYAKLTDEEAANVEGVYQDLLLPLDKPAPSPAQSA